MVSSPSLLTWSSANSELSTALDAFATLQFLYQSLTIISRVDLRPVTSHDETSEEIEELRANLEAEASTSRRRTVFREFLSLRHRPNATPEERIYALRRLREQQRRDATAAANASAEDGGDRRRSRMSARLSGVFSGRRRDRSPTQQGESGRIGGQQVQRDTSPTREMMAVAMLAGARHM